LRPIRTVPAAVAAKFESLGTLLSRHRAVTRVSAVALALTVIFTLAAQDATFAGPQSGPGAAVEPASPESILPQSIGAGVATNATLTIPFELPMDRASVEAGLQLFPHQPFALAWNADSTALRVRPDRLWRTDETYVFVVSGDVAAADGTTLDSAERFSFTTATAPTISDFQVRFAPTELDAELRNSMVEVDPERGLAGGVSGAPELDTDTTAQAVSANTAITITFNATMDRVDTAERFTISPAADGQLSWEGDALVFRPSERFTPGKRYTVSLVGAHDAAGNVIGGKANFSFVVRQGAQLTKVRPGIGEANVEPETIEMWFSQPMDADATNAVVTVVDKTAETAVAASLEWNEAATQLTLTPDDALAAGHQFEVKIGDGARDQDGNAVARTWSFTTLPPEPAVQRSSTTTRSSTPVVIPPPAPSGDAATYALNQINASRAAYGFGAISLDASISAVAYAHAYDQAVNGYFSHTSLDGRTREDRLRAGGVRFGWSGENQCYLVGRSVQATLDWCHAQFMAEPYPGEFNHIANVLSPNANRVGVGIAQVGSKIVICWDFTD
jgi:uncharacterized protein YkwD